MSSLMNIKELGIDEKVFSALKSSVYPGAKDESIILAWKYCQAKGYDPMKKPVHIVPMSVKTGRKNQQGYDEYETRDVIMPGINQYRIDAARTGCHVGTSEPEFGEDITEIFKDSGDKGVKQVTLTYPKWCRVKVKKLDRKTGVVYEFSHVEFWKENYAKAGRGKTSPNQMWQDRSYAQLAKCTEAQVLRKAFPDDVPMTPTAEEMEGRIIENETETINIVGRGINGARQALGIKTEPAPVAEFRQPEKVEVKQKSRTVEHEQEIVDTDTGEVFVPPNLATKQQVDDINSLIVSHGFGEVSVNKWLSKANVTCFAEMTAESLQALIDGIIKKVAEGK